MADIDMVIDICINDQWSSYDKTKCGFLNKEQAKLFIKNAVDQLGEEEDFSEEAFEANYKEFDKDGKGISKEEMKNFIKRHAGM